MGLLDKFRETFASRNGEGSGGSDLSGLGGGAAERPIGPPDQSAAQQQAGASGRDPDEVAVERYRYMLRTAPPETLEHAHAEAFAKLSRDQRRKVLEDLGNAVPASERAAADDPRSLARMATRAEMREPGTMERALGGGRGGMGGMGRGLLPVACLPAWQEPSSAQRSPTPSSAMRWEATRWPAAMTWPSTTLALIRVAR